MKAIVPYFLLVLFVLGVFEVTFFEKYVILLLWLEGFGFDFGLLQFRR